MTNGQQALAHMRTAGSSGMPKFSTASTCYAGTVLERGRALAAGCMGRNRRGRMKCGEGRREAAKDSELWKPRADLQCEYRRVRFVT